MNLRSVTIVLVLLVGCRIAPAQTTKPTLNSLSWLAGCWEGSARGRHIDEQWMKPAGGLMLGTARTIVLGKPAEFEFTQIRQDKDGSIYYVAKPSGQAEASFKLVKLENKEVVFENPEHDFPQRIIYRLEANGSLFARVEATVNGQVKAIDYLYHRSKCE
jgi:hypothetical protein